MRTSARPATPSMGEWICVYDRFRFAVSSAACAACICASVSARLAVALSMSCCEIIPDLSRPLSRSSWMRL